MFLNETLFVLAYTANIMATLPEKTDVKNVSVAENITTTTLSPEEKENKFDLDDQWYMWRCFEPYGCFYIGAPWSGENRPVSTFPARPDSINPRYTLYTRKQADQTYELKIDDFETIRETPLNKKNNFYFIIHGFLDNGDKTWVLRTMKELLLREDCNVMIVNWLAGAGPPYTQAVANTRLVGAMTARLAAQLIEIGEVPSSRMHCIGHSLGAHTCGYVGYTLSNRYGYKLGRITGLDPAEPHFSNTSPMVRLDPTDATFVTAIHTDCNPFISGGLGITQPVAHIDFYPNGGRNQPGCNEGVLNSITLERGSFFREGHYKVTINISKTDESLLYGGEVGMFIVRAIGSNGKKTEKMQLSSASKYYEPGSTHTIVLPGDVVGKPNSVEITWEYQTSVFNPLTWRLLHTPRAYIDSLTIKSLETDHEITLCPDNTKTLIANQPKILTVEKCRNAEHNTIST
ncbi:pancreatic lipase-related protein 2 isoform X2 [Polyergus mexicanus]|uniref:pancreatic lipase-related protein 2 isoform X2 n=1 Tax=Polyergus mexicanus TaxID=615972 RepID=UPI0038B6050E